MAILILYQTVWITGYGAVAANGGAGGSSRAGGKISLTSSNGGFEKIYNELDLLAYSAV